MPRLVGLRCRRLLVTNVNACSYSDLDTFNATGWDTQWVA